MFVDELFDKTEDYMTLFKNNEKYILFDKFVFELTKNNMSWLFKVYLEKFNILKDENITNYMKEKYFDIDLICENGNLFVNKNLVNAIINELIENKMILLEGNTYKIK